ncbi:hypothetical protein BH10ACT7_BH10ACT7_23390 [soil metagenome]
MKRLTIVDTYENPIARDGDFADPFVIRFNGRYYLYCTNPDVRCWSSSDLVTWQLEGATIAQDVFPGLVPFAPEVIYSNGSFYMYTSPSGHGHYVLRSDNPTGPFELVSGNIEHSIDGNVFLDDDGRWYFYWAGDEGIWGCEMTSPVTFGEPVLTGAQMNGWTEGPFVTKRDGIYHMTLTGNHYLNAGYRINAAVSTHPLHGYVDDPLNPILLSVDGPVTGLGHSSSVVGPDLVSTYMIYHNLNPDESRDLNIDRQVGNGSALQVLGPTVTARAPRMPDAAVDWTAGIGVDDWDVRGGALVAEGAWARLTGTSASWTAPVAAGPFTVEITVIGSDDGAYGLEIGAARVRVDGSAIALMNGDRVVTSAVLPADFVHAAAHCYRIVGDGIGFVLFLDGRRQLAWEGLVTDGAGIGVFGQSGCRVGYCAITAGTEDSQDRLAPKPTPGRFWAALAEVPTAAIERETAGYDILRLDPQVEAAYELDVASPGEYTVYLTGEFVGGDAVGLSIDGSPDQRATAEQPTAVLAVTTTLEAGRQALRIRGAGGAPRIALVTVRRPPTAPKHLPAVTARVDGCGKVLVGAEDWHDFTVVAEIEGLPESDAFHGGVIFRASELSEGGSTGDDAQLGIDFLLGYSVEIHGSKLRLSRHDYDTRVLGVAALAPATSRRLTVRVRGGMIEVAVDGYIVLTHTDRLPHLVGGVGVRAFGGTVIARELTVTAD